MHEKNSRTLGQCILDCKDDTNCEAACVSSFKNNYSECPCQEKCPFGCPCENYECNLPDKKAILVLYSGSSKPSVLIQPNGKFERCLFDTISAYKTSQSYQYQFKVVRTSNLKWMITPKFTVLARLHSMVNYLFLEATIRRSRWSIKIKIAIISVNKLLQVSKVIGCGLQRIGDLAFDFVLGTCATYNFPTERILLCFASDRLQTCLNNINFE